MSEEISGQVILSWYETDLLPRLVKEGRFAVEGVNSNNLKITKIKHEETNRGTDHFASVPYFTQLTLQDANDSAKSKTFRIITKFITQNIATREAMETDVQFYNEMVFYNEIIPVFEKYLLNRPKIPSHFLEDICPVCRYAHIDLSNPDYGVVIMDDLREEGYACAKSKVELDLDYCLVSVRKLAKLHAVSYAMKIENFNGFEKLANSFKECRYQENLFKEEMQNYFYSETSLRGINYLLSQTKCEVPKAYLESLKKKVSSNFYKTMGEYVRPKEPLAVICHGDFCRNNILYKLSNDRPIDCKLFDYQTWRYAPPAVDLTFFIYMNTTLELREKHFDEIIQAYYDTLIDTISNITSKSITEIKDIYPHNLFIQDYADHSLYAYAIIAFFLPMMMAPKDDPSTYEDDFFSKTVQEMTKENLELGGEVVTKRISEVIIDMYRRKF